MLGLSLSPILLQAKVPTDKHTHTHSVAVFFSCQCPVPLLLSLLWPNCARNFGKELTAMKQKATETTDKKVNSQLQQNSVASSWQHFFLTLMICVCVLYCLNCLPSTETILNQQFFILIDSAFFSQPVA